MSVVIVQPVNATDCPSTPLILFTYFYEALLDTDNNDNTGGNVDMDGMKGFEYRVTAYLNSDAKIFEIRLWKWDEKCGWIFVKTIDVSTYSPQTNAGVDDSDVVEFYVQKLDVGNPLSMRIVYHATRRAPGSDFTDQFFYPAMQIPTMTQWGVMALILLFGIGSLFILRRHKRLSGFLIVLISLLTVAGITWAPILITPPGIDGAVGDWNGIAPAVTDNTNDSTLTDPSEEIWAGFIRSETADFSAAVNGFSAPTFFFRMDIEDITTIVVE
jgi:hypothetical protein